MNLIIVCFELSGALTRNPGYGSCSESEAQSSTCESVLLRDQDKVSASIDDDGCPVMHIPESVALVIRYWFCLFMLRQGGSRVTKTWKKEIDLGEKKGQCTTDAIKSLSSLPNGS